MALAVLQQRTELAGADWLVIAVAGVLEIKGHAQTGRRATLKLMGDFIPLLYVVVWFGGVLLQPEVIWPRHDI